MAKSRTAKKFYSLSFFAPRKKVLFLAALLKTFLFQSIAIFFRRWRKSSGHGCRRRRHQRGENCLRVQRVPPRPQVPQYQQDPRDHQSYQVIVILCKLSLLFKIIPLKEMHSHFAISH